MASNYRKPILLLALLACGFLAAQTLWFFWETPDSSALEAPALSDQPIASSRQSTQEPVRPGQSPSQRQPVARFFFASVHITREGDPRPLNGQILLVRAADEFGDELEFGFHQGKAEFKLASEEYLIDTAMVGGWPQDVRVEPPTVLSPRNRTVHVSVLAAEGRAGGTLQVLDAETREHISQVIVRLEASKFGQGRVSKRTPAPYLQAPTSAEKCLEGASPLWIPHIPKKNRLWITAEGYDWQTVDAFQEGQNESVLLNRTGGLRIEVDPAYFEQEPPPEEPIGEFWVSAETSQGHLARHFPIQPTSVLRKISAGPVQLKIAHASQLGHGLVLYDSTLVIKPSQTTTQRIHPDKPDHGLAPASLTLHLLSNFEENATRSFHLVHSPKRPPRM